MAAISPRPTPDPNDVWGAVLNGIFDEIDAWSDTVDTTLATLATNITTAQTTANNAATSAATANTNADAAATAASSAATTAANAATAAAAAQTTANAAVPNTRTVTVGSAYLTGGGDLSTNRTIDLATSTKTSLSKADSALQAADVPVTNEVKITASTVSTFTVDNTVTPAAIPELICPLTAGLWEIDGEVCVSGGTTTVDARFWFNAPAFTVGPDSHITVRTMSNAATGASGPMVNGTFSGDTAIDGTNGFIVIGAIGNAAGNGAKVNVVTFSGTLLVTGSGNFQPTLTQDTATASAALGVKWGKIKFTKIG